MKAKTSSGSQNEKKMIVLGFISIVVLFIIYARFENPGITPDAVSSIERLSISFYILLTISFGIIGIGLRKYQRKAAATGNRTAISMICNSTISKNSLKVFIITFVVYGFFFSMTSGILIYQPEVTFSYHYGAEIPSAHITPCCGPVGYMPKIIGYMTEHVGLQIIPINLVLQVTVSYLVATNTALAAVSYTHLTLPTILLV